MTTHIFIHGSFHAGWNWHRVIPLMAGLGHPSYAPDLPGHGRDPMPPHKVTLEACVDAIASQVVQSTSPVVLVAHSRSGIVASQVAERLPERLAGLVYLAAYLVPHGRSMMDYAVLDTESLVFQNVRPKSDAATLKRATARLRRGWLRRLLSAALPRRSQLHALERRVFREALYHDCPHHITTLAQALLEPEPHWPGFTPLRLSASRFGSVPKVYIRCSEDRAVTPMLQDLMLEETPCDRVLTLASSHSPFFSCPERLVAQLQLALLEFPKAQHV